MTASPQMTLNLPVFSINEYSNPDLPYDLVRSGNDRGDCYVIMNGQKIKMPIRVAILNFLCWKPLFEYGLQPSKSEIFNFKSITTDSLSKVHTVIYERLLDAYPNIDDPYFDKNGKYIGGRDPEKVDEKPDMKIHKEDFLPKGHMKFAYSLAKNVEDIENFIKKMLSGYWPSIDGLMLARLVNSPDFKDLINAKYDVNLGTQIVEQQIKANSTELLRRLANPNLKGNCLYPYMTASALKSNQIGQNVLLYGTRSEVDDSMKKNVVLHSAFSGLRDTTEFAVESLAAKKATYLLKNSTKASSYYGRKLKLSSMCQSNIYRGSCGSEFIMPYKIPEKNASCFLDKMIIDKGETIILTKGNLNNYVNKEVRMISPFGCNHTDGICERCAGFGKGRLISYLPLGIHVGIFSIMQLSKVVTQKVLSSKHLIATKTMLYSLTDQIKEYLYQEGDQLFWNPKIQKNLDHLSIKIPSDGCNPIVDIGMPNVIPDPETFSKISYFYIMKDGEIVDKINMEQEAFIPFLTRPILEFMHEHYSELTVDDEGIIVRMKGFNPSNAVFQYTIINDDMLSYLSSLTKFSGSDIAEYTDLTKALEDFSRIVYNKSQIPFFYLEMAIRNFLITSENNYEIPVVQDPHHVRFDKLSEIITNRETATKLAFEQLKSFLDNPETFIHPKKAGTYASMFGLL